MKSRFDILQFSFAISLFVVLGSAFLLFLGDRTVFVQTQIAGTAGSGDVDPVAKADALLKFLDDLQKEIDVISLAQQTSALQGQVRIVDTKGFGTAAFRFNEAVGPFLAGSQFQERTLMVQNNSAQSLTFVSFDNLGGAFSFKGGSFPGTGGTCAAVIPKGDCTLVFLFEPAKGTGVLSPTGDSLLHRTPPSSPAQLTYKVGQNIFKSNPLVFLGYSVLPADVYVSVDRIVPTPVGGQTSFRIIFASVANGDPAQGSNLKFSNAAVSGLAEPFYLKDNRCAPTASVPAHQCTLGLLYRPTVAGTNKLDLTARWSDGYAPKSKTLALEAQAVGPVKLDDHPELQTLVVYNLSDSESVALKDYYIANRPEFSGVSVLGIRYVPATSCLDIDECVRGEAVHKYWYKQTTADPIGAWLQAHPDKQIKYLVLMRGIPIRFLNWDVSEDGMVGSVQNALHSRFGVLPTSLNMGSVDATVRYIDKLKTMYAAMPVKSSVISAKNTGKGGDTYYISDAQALAYETVSPSAGESADVLHDSNLSAKIVRRGFRDPVISSASDVAGFLSRGLYGYGYDGNYALDGTVRFSGTSGWYLIQTMESFNGMWAAGDVPNQNFQGNFVKWFSRNAFGGTYYENTPVAAVTHVQEPGLPNVNGPSLFPCWDSGQLFAFCAWSSAPAGLITLQAVGDPFVTR